MLRRGHIVRQIAENAPDDIWLAAISFEPRCLNAAHLLAPGYRTRRAVLFRYHGKDELRLRDTHQDALEAALAVHLEGATPVDVLWCDKDDPMHGMFKLQEILGRDRTADHLRITVDITTFTKQYLLVLLKWIEHHLPNAAVRTVYTPGQYGETRAQQARFTWGVKDIVTVPMYGMPPSPESSDVLVIFLGYERERTYRLWRTLEPDLTIAVIGVPPAFPGANYTSEILNARILNSKTDDIAIRSCSAVDPADAARLLCDVAAEHEGCNLVVAPLGTKMQTLGLYLFSRRREGRAAQIMYALPLRYDEKYYTVGHTSYVYEFDLAGAPK